MRLQYGLEEIMQLRPVQFEWKDNSHDPGTKLGLIAQELQQIMPEVVRDWDWEFDEDGTAEPVRVPATRLGVYYSDIIPVLINGMQEQQMQVEPLQTRIEELEASNSEWADRYLALEERLNQLEASLSQCCANHSSNPPHQSESDESSLGQNIPNPFGHETLISYYLSSQTELAELRVFDQSGKLIQSFRLSETGFGQVDFSHQNLESGIYLYTLVTDGQAVATKQMVIQR